MKFSLIFIISLIFSLAACTHNEEKSISHEQAVYKVSKFSSSPQINAEWDKKPWSDIKSLHIGHVMGERPEHFPYAQAKIGYDESALYVIFRVKDKYVKAVHPNHQDPVYKDSCVEFFFTPGGDLDAGYFNLEMNCGGTMLFHHQMKPRKDRISISEADIQNVTVAHSLPKLIDPEIEEKTTWVVEYRIPFSILKNYHDFSKPESGTAWRANLYKCADDTSHPHWLTWSPIDFPRPNFHVPEYFGLLEFQD